MSAWSIKYNDTYSYWRLNAPSTPVAGLPKTVVDCWAYAPYIESELRSTSPTAEQVYLRLNGDTATKERPARLARQKMFNASNFTEHRVT